MHRTASKKLPICHVNINDQYVPIIYFIVLNAH